MNVCPECGKSLPEKAKRCSCGWIKEELQERAVLDGRCKYQYLGRRCLLPGTTSPHPYKGGWYCRRHGHSWDDPQRAVSELDYIERNYQKIMEVEYSS